MLDVSGMEGGMGKETVTLKDTALFCFKKGKYLIIPLQQKVTVSPRPTEIIGTT